MHINNKRFAELTLSMFRARGIEFTYDEAAGLLKYYDEQLQYLPVADPAYDHFTKERNEILRYMLAFDLIHGLGRKEHLIKYSITIEDKAGEIYDIEVEIPRYPSNDTMIDAYRNNNNAFNRGVVSIMKDTFLSRVSAYWFDTGRASKPAAVLVDVVFN